jgi:predicted aspartyl protease
MEYIKGKIFAIIEDFEPAIVRSSSAGDSIAICALGIGNYRDSNRSDDYDLRQSFYAGDSMTAIQEPTMGRFSVEVELANHEDLFRAKAGLILPEQVRRVRVRGVVDSGATRLVIPANIAQQLGLESAGSAKVRYADGRTAERTIVKDVHLAYAGRESVFNAIVEPGRESVLIGAIVLEDLDFLVDCGAQRLVPRDPKQIISEAE